MDAAKLLRVVHDTQNNEKTLGVASKIDAIRNDISQNNAAAVETARLKFEELRSAFETQSISYTFSDTETRLLQEIDATAYVGRGLIEHLESILKSRGFEMTTIIDEYRTERNEAINKVWRLATSLQEVGIGEYRPDGDEISIVFPEEDGDLQKLQGHLNKFKRILTVVAELAGGDYQHVRISRISSGSPLEFFSLQPIETAALFSDLLRNVAWGWEKIKKLKQKAEEAARDNLLNEDTRKAYRDALAVQASGELDKLTSELPDQILKKASRKPDTQRENEVRQELKAAIRFIFGWLNAGVEIDITLSRKQTTSEEDQKQRDPGKEKIIREANVALQEIYKLPKEDRILPLPAAYTNEEAVAPNEVREIVHEQEAQE